MSDAIRAALITGGVQLTTGLLTLLVALLALNSWRRNALGARQIQLAEECLQSVWKLDAEIKAARMLLFPGSLKEIKCSDNQLIKENYNKNHYNASIAMHSCIKNLKDLNHQLMLAEFYLGSLPKIKIPHAARFFGKMPYSLYQEYDEVIPSLLVCLMRTSPETIDSVEVTQESIDEFDKSANLFYGFMYEYEEDDYSVRLKVSRIAFERHIKRILKRQGLFDRILEKVSHLIEDNINSRFKPVTLNKRPIRKWLEDYKNKTSE